MDSIKRIPSIIKKLSLSKDSLNKIQTHLEILIKWQKQINLVGHSTLNDLWVRHVLDSGQLNFYLPPKSNNKFLLDVGSGAGFPGLVLAAMGREDISICEKENKKVIFMKEVVRATGIKTKLYAKKVENFNCNQIGTIMSRAFSSINILMHKAIHLIDKETTMILLKGKKLEEEIKEAKRDFTFVYTTHPSISSKHGKVIKINKIKRIYDEKH